MAYVICNKCKHVFPFPFLTSFPFESPDIPGLQPECPECGSVDIHTAVFEEE